jgi:hypothetical protein
MSTASWARIVVATGLVAVVSVAGAQEGGGIPTHEGKGSVTEALDADHGAIFDIGGGVVMSFPKGLPVGHSRLVTLKKAKKKPPAAQIAKNFKPLGVALEFDGALHTAGKPVVLSMTMKSDPSKAGQKIVLAMEVATFCEAHNKAFKLSGGLCSGWELREASYEAGRIVAKLRSTGGMRMQFGMVPEDSE